MDFRRCFGCQPPHRSYETNTSSSSMRFAFVTRALHARTCTFVRRPHLQSRSKMSFWKASAGGDPAGGFGETTVQDLQEKIGAGQDVVVVDVREPSEYAEGHVPGATNVPLGTVVDAAKQGRFEAYADREVHVICQLGGRSTKACTALAQELPDTKLVNVKGGTAEWMQAGFQVEK